MVNGLIDLVEQEIKDISSIASASTFEDFIKAISKSKLEKFKSINEQQIVSDIKKSIEDLKNDSENLESFLKISKNKKEDFKSDEDLDKFLIQKIYEKEFSELRQGSLNSIADGLKEIQEKIIGDLSIDDLEVMTSTTLGNDLYITIKSAMERLEEATSSVSELKKNFKAKNI
jgi:DNA mismatch repair ATPase MutS